MSLVSVNQRMLPNLWITGSSRSKNCWQRKIRPALIFKTLQKSYKRHEIINSQPNESLADLKFTSLYLGHEVLCQDSQSYSAINNRISSNLEISHNKENLTIVAWNLPERLFWWNLWRQPARPGQPLHHEISFLQLLITRSSRYRYCWQRKIRPANLKNFQASRSSARKKASQTNHWLPTKWSLLVNQRVFQSHAGSWGKDMAGKERYGQLSSSRRSRNLISVTKSSTASQTNHWLNHKI